MQRYSSNELMELTDQQLLSRLRQAWGYDNNDPIAVIGQLKKIETDSSEFFIIENVRHRSSGIPFIYPTEDERVFNTVFVGRLRHGWSTGDWVSCLLELSPASERKKHNNPFAMKAVSGSLSELTSLDDILDAAIASTEDGAGAAQYIEEWALDVARTRALTSIEKEVTSLQDSLSSLQEQESQVSAQVTEKSKALKAASFQLKEVMKDQKAAEAEFSKKRARMENTLNSLSRFIEEKTKVLVDLDLIDSDNHLLSSQSASAVGAGHDFDLDLGASKQRLIAYVQAYLAQHGIMYSRAVLEDFYTLLCTNDLIILAGDSGSGKTSLVKWFARAIGGKAVVVPVKPGWTSADDLLGYYNPLDKKFLATPFLEALLEAAQYPDVPYFICLDEMNLARVEYYFADFLSLLEERGSAPEVPLYSDTEANNLLSEARLFLTLIDEARADRSDADALTFVDMMRDPEVNQKLHELCGFRDGESLLRYHAHLRKLLSGYLNMPSTLTLPPNVRIIGAINVDDTTHYLSPKILDRAHLMRFGNPLLADWQAINAELESFDLDMALPVRLSSERLGARAEYPAFDPSHQIGQQLLKLVREYLAPMGLEFGMRTIRQAQNYADLSSELEVNEALILNRIILHKVLPKLVLDGEKRAAGMKPRKDLLLTMRSELGSLLSDISLTAEESALAELDRVIHYAQENDWVINYWAR